MSCEGLLLDDREDCSKADGPTFDGRRILLHALIGVVLVLVGALEGLYGRLELFGDDISYLDVTNLIRAGDWKEALNPLWSIGYPLMLAAVRPIFATTPRGELEAVFCLNLLIYVAAWISFLWFLRMASNFVRRDVPEERGTALSPFLVVCAACIFVTVEVAVGRVSSVGPDLLVTCLFFLASGLALRFISRPSTWSAVLWGAVMGVGFLAKAFFLPLSCVLLATAIICKRGSGSFKPFLAATSVLLVSVGTYGLCLSWALGRPTLGESGALNYAFHVNRLPHWMGWQGGPNELGSPVHPVQMLHSHPAVFAFGEPFHVTYPPQFNLVYWYEGYHRFFNIKNAVRAVAANLHDTQYLFGDVVPVCVALVLCVGLVVLAQRGRRAWIKQVWKEWPWYLPSLVLILLYMQVHLEGRYVAGFLAVLAMVPFVALDRWRGPARAAVPAAVLIVLVAATTLNMAYQLRGAVRSAAHGVDMQSEGQWKIARYLQAMGLGPGDRVASVSPGNNIRCTWAYAARLHVVAAIGNDVDDPQSRMKDLHLFFDDRATQDEVLQLFRRQGAVAVVATQIPFEVESPGWQSVPGTRAWVLLLGDGANRQSTSLQSISAKLPR